MLTRDGGPGHENENMPFTEGLFFITSISCLKSTVFQESPSQPNSLYSRSSFQSYFLQKVPSFPRNSNLVLTKKREGE